MPRWCWSTSPSSTYRRPVRAAQTRRHTLMAHCCCPNIVFAVNKPTRWPTPGRIRRVSQALAGCRRRLHRIGGMCRCRRCAATRATHWTCRLPRPNLLQLLEPAVAMKADGPSLPCVRGAPQSGGTGVGEHRVCSWGRIAQARSFGDALQVFPSGDAYRHGARRDGSASTKPAPALGGRRPRPPDRRSRATAGHPARCSRRSAQRHTAGWTRAATPCLKYGAPRHRWLRPAGRDHARWHPQRCSRRRPSWRHAIAQCVRTAAAAARVSLCDTGRGALTSSTRPAPHHGRPLVRETEAA